MTMRAAYLSLDRPDIAFAVKELARGMSTPTQRDLRALRRLGRFLVKESRLVQYFPWQKLPETLTAESDSDYAGCTRSRKSTTGFAARLGKPLYHDKVPTPISNSPIQWGGGLLCGNFSDRESDLTSADAE